MRFDPDSFSPRRVLMTADAVGGVWTYATALAAELGRRGVSVALATMGPCPRDSQHEAVRGMRNVYLYESAYRLEWMSSPWHDVSAAGKWLLGLRDEYNPDVIHLNNFAHADLAWGLPTVLVGHSCVFSWHESVEHRLPGSEWEAYRRAVRNGLRAAGEVVAPTWAMLDALHRHYGVDRGMVIANGCSDEIAQTKKDPLIFACGRLWDQAKNIQSLCAIAEKLEWPVYVAGENIDPEGRSGTELKGVHFLGELSHAEALAWMSRAAVFALPARYEPFGLSALEAARAGCALVLGDIPSLREVWKNAAIYVNPGDPDALATALRRIASEPRLVADYSSKARARAESFRLDRMVDAYLGLYKRLMRHGAGALAIRAESRGREETSCTSHYFITR